MNNNNSVTTLVYKYNEDSIFIIIVYGIYFFIYGFSFLSLTLETRILFGVPLIAFPLYVRFSKTSAFKVRIVDDNRLTFSTNGIQFGDDIYSVSGIESEAIYLYSFDNFEYRDGYLISPTRGTTNTYNIAEGDQNTISFRYKGEVIDFTFFIADYARFCAVRRVLNDWASQNINVVLKQAFDDNFIIQEMDRFGTPSRLNN